MTCGVATLWGMIYWLWTAFEPVIVIVIELDEWWDNEDEHLDVAWLGELAWTGRFDNSGMGLK